MGSQELLQGSLKQHANLYSAREEGLQGSQVIQNRHLQSLLTELKQSQRPKRDLEGSSPQVPSNNFTNNQNNYVYNQLSENCRDSLDTFTHHTRFTQNTPDLMQNSERRARPKYTGASVTEGNRTERQHTSPNIRLTEAINTRSSVKKSHGGSQMEEDDAELTKLHSERRSEMMRDNIGQTMQTSVATELIHTRNVSKGILKEQTTGGSKADKGPEGLRLTAEEREARRHLESMGSSGVNDDTANISKYVELNFYHQSQNEYLVPLQRDAEQYQRKSNMEALFDPESSKNTASLEARNRELEQRLNNLEHLLQEHGGGAAEPGRQEDLEASVEVNGEATASGRGAPGTTQVSLLIDGLNTQNMQEKLRASQISSLSDAKGLQVSKRSSAVPRQAASLEQKPEVLEQQQR